MCKAKSSHVKVSDETGCYSPLFTMASCELHFYFATKLKLDQFVGGLFTAF